MSDLQFRLDLDELAGMGDLVEVRQSGISPMMPGKSLTDEQAEILKKKGILDSSGKIVPVYRPALETIASAGYYARVRMSGGSSYLECVIYFSSDYKRSTAVFSTNEGLLVQDPAPVKDILKGLKQFIGESVLQSSGFKAELGAGEAVVLAALIDLQRRENLKSLAEGSDGPDRGFAFDEISNAAASKPVSAQWIVTVIKEMTMVNPDREAVRLSLESLVDSGLAKSKEDRYFLADEARELTNQLLLVNNLLSLKAGREMEDGTVVQVGFACLQDGVTDLLLVETSEDNKVRFEALSSVLLFKYADLFLSDPVSIQMLIPDETVLSEAVSDTESAKERSGEVQCSGCKQLLPPDALFCSACGRQVDRAAADQGSGFCRGCGTGFKYGDRFCSECGSAIQ